MLNNSKLYVQYIHQPNGQIILTDDNCYEIGISMEEAEVLLKKLEGILYPPIPVDEIRCGDTVEVTSKALVVARNMEDYKTTSFEIQSEGQLKSFRVQPNKVKFVKHNNFNQRCIGKEYLFGYNDIISKPS